MNKPIAVLLAVLWVSPALAQQEKGDVELQFTGSIFSTVNNGNISTTSGLVQTKFGYFFTDRLELGVYPSLTVSRIRIRDAQITTTDTRVGMGVFGIYSFLSGDALTVPYVGGQYYKSDLRDENEQGWAGVNAGLKFYMNRRTAFDVSGNYLFGLEQIDSGLLLFQAGLSFLL